MSHRAMTWSWSVRGLHPGARVVLQCLADCHNPVNGCFPSQDYIARECEISRRSVNTHLDFLESRGVILRMTSIDDITKRQRPTRYYLAFEDGFIDALKLMGRDFGRVQELHTEPCAEFAQDPCADSSKSRVQNLHTNLVRETCNKPARGKAPGSGRRTGPVEPAFLPPYPDAKLRARIAAVEGDLFVVSYLDSAKPGPGGSILTHTRYAADKLRSCPVVRAAGIAVTGPP